MRSDRRPVANGIVLNEVRELQVFVYDMTAVESWLSAVDWTMSAAVDRVLITVLQSEERELCDRLKTDMKGVKIQYNTRVK